MKHAFGAWALAAALAAVPVSSFGQQAPPVPQPYPRPGQASSAPAKPPVQSPAPAQAAPAAPAAGVPGIPDEATLGVPIYPSAQFLTSYDAGRGQRFYIFGTTGGFAEVVAFYRSVLKQKGELVFDEPATHVFEVGRFREDTMAFPPGVTVKDYTWGGMQGYANPKPGAEPGRFPTVVQVVPAPPATAVPGRN